MKQKIVREVWNKNVSKNNWRVNFLGMIHLFQTDTWLSVQFFLLSSLPHLLFLSSLSFFLSWKMLWPLLYPLNLFLSISPPGQIPFKYHYQTVFNNVSKMDSDSENRYSQTHQFSCLSIPSQLFHRIFSSLSLSAISLILLSLCHSSSDTPSHLLFGWVTEGGNRIC